MSSTLDLPDGLSDEKDRLVGAYNRIGAIILDTPDLQEALGKLAREIVEVGIFRSLMVALVDEDGGGVEVVQNLGQYFTSRGQLPSWKTHDSTIGLRYAIDDENITAVVARTGEMAVIEEWDDRFDARTDRPEYRSGQVSYFVPVRKGDRTLAVVATASTIEEKDTCLRKIEVIQPLLGQVAIAIEHARLVQGVREREARLKAILNNASIGIAVADNSGRFLGVNDHFVHMLGYGSEAEVIALTFLDITDPRDQAASKSLFKELVLGKRTEFHTQKRYVRRDGSVFWGEVSVSPIDQGDRGVQSYCAVLNDISDRKQAEQLVQESEQRYRAVVEDQTEFIVRWTPDGTRTFVNDSYCRYFGASREDLIGTSFYPTIHPDDLDEARRHLEDLTPDNPAVVTEHRSRAADGTMTWQEWTDRAIFDADGNVVEYQSVGRDISKRKQAEDQLRFQAQLLDSVNEAIVATDMDGRILYWGRGATELYNVDAADVVGRRVADLIDESAHRQLDERVEAVLEKGYWTGTLKRHRRNGEPFWSYSTISLFHDADGKPAGFVAIDRDVTDVKDAEEERVRTQRLRAAAELSAGVSHNLNNILTGVLGYGEILRGLVTDPKHAEYLDHIVQSGIRASDLIHRLHLSTREGHRDKLVPVDVSATIDAAIQITRPRWKDELEARGASIDLSVVCVDVPPVMGTPTGLHDILVNLILNAVDVMPDGGDLSIRARAVGDDRVEIIVRDSGCGMDEETAARVFEPFFTTKQDVGTGLGLSVSLTAVEGWGGSMGVDTTPGSGTAFRILLRACPEVEEAENTPPTAQGDPREAAFSILIVEDEPVVASLLGEVLGDSHEISIVHAGAQAIERNHERPFDVAFIDMGLPGTPGDRVRKALTEHRPTLTTVLMTGWEDRNLGERGHGFDFRLQKPFKVTDVEAVMEKVGRAVRRRRNS